MTDSPARARGVPGTSATHWSVLGCVEGRRGGEPVDLGPPRRRAVLAVLLAADGRPVPMPTIVRTLWGDFPPTYAVNIVHRQIGELRRIVDPALPRRAEGTWLLAHGASYHAVVSEAVLDLRRFRTVVRDAEHAADRSDQLDSLCEALELSTGPVAEDVRAAVEDDGPFVAIEREIAAVALRAGALALELDRPRAVVEALERVARDNPLDERLAAVLFRCLAAVGRRGEAVARFAALQKLLDDELGVRPDLELQTVHRDLIADPAAATTTVGPVPVVQLVPPPAQLPGSLARFVGREQQLHDLRLAAGSADDAMQLSLVLGAPGVGKTSLAVQAAREQREQFADGQLYVDLQGFGPDQRPLPAVDVLARFLRALGVVGEAVPADLDERATLWRTVASRRRLLIVLDNARDASQVRPLLPGSPGCHVIVTSRTQLRGLAGIARLVVSLGGFSAAESLLLLHRQLGDSRVEADGTVARSWHELCGGLPLGLSLLAARASHSPPVGLAEIDTEVRRARRSLSPFIDSGDSEGNARAVLSWSFDAAGADAQRLWILLALYPQAEIARGVAIAVTGDTAQRVDVVLDELVQVGLLVRVRAGVFSRHDLLRRYAHERLVALDPVVRRDAELRLYDVVSRRAKDAAMTMAPDRLRLDGTDPRKGWSSTVFPDARHARQWFTLQHEALVALTKRAGRFDHLNEYCWRLAWALDAYLDRHRSWSDNVAVQQVAAAAARSRGQILVEATANRALARGVMHLGDLDRASALASATLDTLDRTGLDAPLIRHQLYVLLSRGQHWGGEALQNYHYSSKMLEVLEPDDLTTRRVNALAYLAWAESRLGRGEDALRHGYEALRLVGDHSTYHLGTVLGSIAAALRCLGRYAEALALNRRTHDHFSCYGSILGQADATVQLGDTLVRAGHPTWARACYQQALQQLEEIGHGTATIPRARLQALDVRHDERRTSA